MTGEIFHEIHKSLHSKLKVNGRLVLLIMDYAGYHPIDVLEKCSNIKVIFLPPNTTSKLAIGPRNYYDYYCKLLMLYNHCTSCY